MSSTRAKGGRPRALMSWSSGKDSTWALHRVLTDAAVEVVGLLTTFNARFDRVSMQGVRRELVQAQADRLGLPLWPVDLPWPCPTEVYEQAMAATMERARNDGVTQVIFGDLFLEDVRDYRTGKLAGTGIEAVFPIWSGPDRTRQVALDMIQAGLEATVTAVDTEQLSARFAGRAFDRDFLDDLPEGADPLGENGEFHTFCHAGPMFDRPIGHSIGETVRRDRYVYTDIRPA